MAMSSDFLSAFAQLPAKQQRGVMSLIHKFQTNPRSTGLNYEGLRSPRDSKIRSLRVDRDYRAIIRAPTKGNTYLLLWVDKHNDAYRWARRHHCKVNPETGSIQIYDSPEIRQSTPDSPAVTPFAPSGPFSQYRPRQLVRIGVPEDLVPTVKRIQNLDGLDSRVRSLPNEAYESLFYLLAGDPYETVVRRLETPDERIDTEDVDKALQRHTSRSRFVVLHDQGELESVLNAPLATWRVFLHPSQRRVVERDWNGPVRLLGAAGTGKTVVAMHRARWLARQLNCRRILFFTYNKNLADDIRANLETICSPVEMSRIEVTNLDSWVVRFLKRRGYAQNISFGRERECWSRALDLRPSEPSLPPKFFEAEWVQVVQANGVSTLAEYKRVPRIGRGVRMTRAQRVKIWRVFEEYKAQLTSRGIKELDDLYGEATSLIQSQSIDLGYSSVVVDEAQDLGSPSFRLIRALVPASMNDLFITGDCHQRIYDRKVVLGRCGIKIRGRSHKLRLNYRTTEQTRAWAARLLEGRDIDDLDGGKDDNSGIRSLTSGPDPLLRGFKDADEQALFIVEYLQGLQESGESLSSLCVVARKRDERDSLRDHVRSLGIDTVVIESQSDDQTVPGVRFATMHRVKGLEFERVILASVNSDLVPPKRLWDSIDIGPERGAFETRERALLYVAASRAKKAVLVLSYGNRSQLLDGIALDSLPRRP